MIGSLNSKGWVAMCLLRNLTHCSEFRSSWFINSLDTLRLGQNGLYFEFWIWRFEWTFLNANCCIGIKISLKFVYLGAIDNMSARVEIVYFCAERPQVNVRTNGDQIHWCINVSTCINELNFVILCCTSAALIPYSFLYTHIHWIRSSYHFDFRWV